MKKTLLTIAVAVMTMAANAVTADDFAGMTLRIDQMNGIAVRTGGMTQINESSNAGTMAIQNFYNDTNLLFGVDDEGNVRVAVQTLGGDYDYDTYEMVYYMIVPAADADKSPMDLYSTSLTGKFENGKLTLDPWNIITVNQSFSENKGAKFDEGITTTIVTPNATTQLGLWDVKVNDDWDFLGWEKLPMGESNKMAYAEQINGQLMIANFNEVKPVATFDIDLDAKTVTFPAGQKVYKNNASEYTLGAIPANLYLEEQEGLTNPVVGTIADDMKTITFKDCAVMRIDNPMFYNVQYTIGAPMYECVIVLDEPLDAATAINTTLTSKTVTSVNYVNLAGQTSSKPFDGVNIVVTRYADGTTSTAKVIK